MQVRHHIDSPWCRGKEAKVSKAEITCIWDQRRPFDLAQAYERGPHVDLMNLSCDQDWVAFVNRWGPLWMSQDERTEGRSRNRLDRCWAFQRRFTAYARLLEGFGRADLEGERLRDFLSACQEESRVSGRGVQLAHALFVAWLPHDRAALRLFGKVLEGVSFDEVFALWLRDAEPRSIRHAVAYIVDQVSSVAAGSLLAEWEGVHPRITARINLANLEEALEWMLWNSYWMKKPQMFCQECQQAFWPESAHPRMYCSYDCAHRATDRAWHRRKRATKKKGA